MFKNLKEEKDTSISALNLYLELIFEQSNNENKSMSIDEHNARS